MKYCCYLRDDQDLLADGKSQNERRFGQSFQNMLCSGGIWEEDILINEIEELEKLDASRDIFQETECERSPDNPKRWRILYLLWQMVQQNYQEETTNSRNHSETRIHHKERESQRSISRCLGKVSTWKIRRWRRRPERILGYSNRISFIVIILNREFNLRAETDLSYWTKLLREEIDDAVGGLEKSQNVSSSNCTVANRSRSWTKTGAYSFICTAPSRGKSLVGFWTFSSKYPSYLSSDLLSIVHWSSRIQTKQTIFCVSRAFTRE